MKPRKAGIDLADAAPVAAKKFSTAISVYDKPYENLEPRIGLAEPKTRGAEKHRP